MRPFRRLVMPLDCCVLGRLLGDTDSFVVVEDCVMTMQTANDAASQGPRAPQSPRRTAADGRALLRVLQAILYTPASLFRHRMDRTCPLAKSVLQPGCSLASVPVSDAAFLHVPLDATGAPPR